MNQESEEEEWIDTMAAAKRFKVSAPTLYDLAYAEPARVETRVITKGRMRPKLEFKVADLKRWDEGRTSHWKEKSKQRSETQGQAGFAPALS